jgi:hypothetical protein
MINHQQTYEAAVKDELHKVARANGIDTSMVGYAVSSTFGPVQVAPGQQALMPGWLVMITLRVELVGVAPLAVPTIIPYELAQAGTIHIPDDSDFRGATQQAFSVALDARDALLHPDKAPGNTVQGLVIP